MTKPKPAMKMPELLVYARAVIIGYLAAEVIRIAFYVGDKFATKLTAIPLWSQVIIWVAVALLCGLYVVHRGVKSSVVRIVSSQRFDLMISIIVGFWINDLASPWLTRFHVAVKEADAYWAPAFLLLVCTLFITQLIQYRRQDPSKPTQQGKFITDKEITNESEDLLSIGAQAKLFAEAVLENDRGLVFGIDGPWGIGKTSFINVAQENWDKANDRVIVCRFEPLRHASEPDITDRLIQELSAAIQRQVFAPEFRPAASRYSRLIKGMANVSFLGLNFSLAPPQESVEDLLDVINDVLKRIDRRVIIVIDDLDRLDAKTINNVLFATHRTFKLSQASYILCYDTEVLLANNDEHLKAREFLEKFVTAKLSLFVDNSSVREYLLNGWQQEVDQISTIPSDTMIRLGAVLTELANLLEGESGPYYLPLVGDIRKVKRFVNAMLLMQIEKSDLNRTDFNKGDLIHLMLLHLHYPGLFRDIYAHEAEGQSGKFSIKRTKNENEYKNTKKFLKLINKQKGSAKFLLKQLFHVETLAFNYIFPTDDVVETRACFNRHPFENLKNYLKLIVRFSTPALQDTHILYQDAVKRVLDGAPIAYILSSSEFQTDRWVHAHDHFWTALAHESYNFNRTTAEDAITTLVEYLPRYPAIRIGDKELRQRSIYSLLRLLENSGWGRTSTSRLPNSPNNIVEIAWRIFGERGYEGKALIDRLANVNRGVLGWDDLMTFRLNCSQDRRTQLYNLGNALILNQDEKANTDGAVNKLALKGMRKLSQEIFARFKMSYIEAGRNFFSDVIETPDSQFLGEAISLETQNNLSPQSESDKIPVPMRIIRARTALSSFVIYQLSNPFPPNGSGVGCGFYDEEGIADGKGIAKAMNDYVFSHCFNPDVHDSNVFYFLDYCLANLSGSYFTGQEESGYFATKNELAGGLDPKEMGRYWLQHQEVIKARAFQFGDRFVHTTNYDASYSGDLTGVFDVLDELAKLSMMES